MKSDIILDAVVREIERSGGVVEDIRTAKGSHRMLYWQLGGTKLVLTIPRYNGDWRSLNTARMNVRRQIREASNEPTSV